MFKKIESWLSHPIIEDFSLLALRISAGGFMLVNHGWKKFSNFSEMAQTFPDPLNIGSSKLSLALAVGGEFFACALLLIGFCTRLAAIPALITMLVAGLIVHGQDPLEKKELALLFAAAYFVLLSRGAGRISVDGIFRR